MKLLATLSESKWITEGRAKAHPNAAGTVAHCIPPVFTSYAKVFHPIYEALSVRDRKQTWQEEEEAKGPQLEPVTEVQRVIADVLSQSTLVYGAAHPGSRLVRIRWAELTRRLGMTFVPTLSSWSFTRQFPGRSWPRHLIGPQEGNLGDIERDALASVLHRHIVGDRIFFYFWLLATMDWRADKLFEGTLDEVGLFSNGTHGVRRTPTYWFPEDRSWLVCTNYDLTFTLVGGSEPLIRDLLAHPLLESVPVRPATRVDSNADLENNAY